MYSQAKLRISGSIAEVYLYGKPVEYAYQQPQVQRTQTHEKTDEEKQESRERSLLQTRRSLRTVLQSNAWQHADDSGRSRAPLFVTFTFRENLTDLSLAHREFRHFIKRFNYELFAKDTRIKYLAVPEFQKRGAVHYHVIFFNLPFIEMIYDRINELWGNGFTLVETIKNLNHLVNYVAKYLTADGLDERLQGRKRYFASRGLLKPIETRDENLIANLLQQLPKDKIKYQKAFMGKDGQEIEYINYDFGQGEKIIENEIYKNAIAA